jgi:hypothetical protein
VAVERLDPLEVPPDQFSNGELAGAETRSQVGNRGAI